MKRVTLLLSLVSVLYGCGPAPQPSGPPGPPPAVASGEGDPVEILYETLKGERGDYAGRVLLLDFTAIWSAPCRDALSGLSELNAEFATRGFTVLGLVLDKGTSEELRESLQSVDVEYEIGRPAPGLAEACGGVRAIPTRVLLDRNQRIFKRYEGAVSLNDIRKDVGLLL